MRFFVTGGAGFIGSAFVRMLLDSPATWSGAAPQRPSLVVNFDKLTYAGNLENLAPIANDARYRFVHGDICDATLVGQTIAEAQPDVIVNFAAESHVDRSILSPAPVFETNLRGTFMLLKRRARIKRRASCMSRPMRFTAASRRLTMPTKIIRCGPAAPIQRRKPGRICWRFPTLSPMACR